MFILTLTNLNLRSYGQLFVLVLLQFLKKIFECIFLFQMARINEDMQGEIENNTSSN